MTKSRNNTITLLLCLLPGVGYLLVFFGLPLARVMFGSLTNMAGDFPTISTWQTLFSKPVYVDGLWFSLWLGIAPTIVGLLISLPLAALMQANEASRNLFGALYKIPLVVPGIVAGFLVLVILDQGGTASRLMSPLGVPMPKLVRDQWAIGAIIASAWKAVPFMTLIIGGAMAAISKDVLSSARTLGAGWFTILWRIQLPLAQPGITAAVLLTFISSLGSYVIPSLLGPAYPLPMSVHMFTEGFQEGNWPMVYAMGTLLSAMAIAVLLAYYAIIGSLGRTPAERQ